MVCYLLVGLFLGLTSIFLFYFDCCHRQAPRTIVTNVLAFLSLPNIFAIAAIALSLLPKFGASHYAFSFLLYILFAPLFVLIVLSFLARFAMPKRRALFHSLHFAMLGLFPYWLLLGDSLKTWMHITTHY